MTLKTSTATGTVWAVARLPWRQLSFLVFSLFVLSVCLSVFIITAVPKRLVPGPGKLAQKSHSVYLMLVLSQSRSLLGC